MGQGPSTPSIQETKTESLYEILGVDQSATDIELKKAYKKLALELHPDRNFGNAEEATKKFTKVQAAYDILSDLQERAWYDSHGSSQEASQEPQYGGKVTKAEELKEYLNPEFQAAFFTKDTQDFYMKVGELFRQLAEEEEEAGLDQRIEVSYLPSFGNDHSSWSLNVKTFYDSWSSFSTIKSFSWEDIYRAWDAPDRRTRRAMEMRNKKIRDAAKKEYNQLVRSLVVIVKRRDPRVKKHNKSVAQTKNTSKEKSNKEKMKKAAGLAAQYEPQEWERPGTDDEEEEEESTSDEDDPVDLFECIVCDKIFKTKKQLIEHEKSKKHIKILKQMQWEMAKEGVELGLDEGEIGHGTEKEQEESVEKDDHVEQDHDNEYDNDHQKFANVSSKMNHEQSFDKEVSLEDLLSQLENLKTDSPPPNATNTLKKTGKAKQRRKKKENSTNDFANKCMTCQHVFPSRNKLFEHVKLSKHAAPLPLKG